LSSTREPRAIRIVDDRWTIVRHVVESLAIVAAGLWAFYIFVYQEKIKPASDPASLTTSIDVRRLGRDATRDVLSIDIRLQNSGKTEIDIAADAINVWGERYGIHDVSLERRNATSRTYDHSVPLRSRTLIRTFAELRYRAVGGKDAHITIEPGAAQPLSYIVVVPRGEYDVIRAQTIDVPVKTNQSRKIAIAITGDHIHGLWLTLAPDADAEENDLDTHFSLIP
jgi:hypothetical protein